MFAPRGEIALTMSAERLGTITQVHASQPCGASSGEGHEKPTEARKVIMTPPLRVELEVSRSDSTPTPIVLTAPADVDAGEALDVLGEALGLTEATGTVQARSLLSGAWIDRRSPFADVGLLRGERLSITVGLRPDGTPRQLSRWPERHRGDDGGRVAVNRPPRAVRPEPELSVPVPTKRQHRPARRFPLGAMLIPLGIGLLLVAITKRWEIALFSLFTPVMVAWNYIEERRARADELREYGRTYDEEVAATLEKVEASATDWARWMHQHHPGPAEIAQIGHHLSARLWERQPGDPDFLKVRLGLASRRAPVTLRQDETSRIVAREDQPDYEGAARVSDVPVTVDLAEGPLAVVAGDDELDRSVAWIATQIATLHSPADVLMAGAFADRDTCDWFRWLPQVAHGWVAENAVADHSRGADALLEAAVRVGSARRELRERTHGQSAGEPTLLLFIDGRLRPDATRLAAALACQELGVVVVWLGSDHRAVPASVAHLLTVDLGGSAGQLLAHRGGQRTDLRTESMSRSAAMDLSSSLAPVRDATDVRRARRVPDRVALEELIPDLASPTAMRRRWEKAPLTQLTARLGSSADGTVLLDLGPSGSHALVGGTTGSGKSELLQTMVASIAAEYPPSRVGFLLVDYKGGAAFKDAMHLPHCVGVVTDLDEHLTRRVILALDAEIRRREELLAEAGARDLSELRRLSPSSSPADLVIVVDEFATLAKEIPEFVEGVVDIAARGRSLGLRLVLATQRPAGVINDRIRANVGVRIALRVNDEADSFDVIEDRRAAHIPRSQPGRAFLKIHRDLAEFQSGYVGGDLQSSQHLGITAAPLWAPAQSRPATATGVTALEAVVDSAKAVMRLGRWSLPHVPWLPAIGSVVTVTDLATQVTEVAPGSALLGLADLPSQQAQRVVVFDLAQHQSMLVFGTSRSGKTTLLRTLAAGLIESMTPDQVQIYGLDFAGHGLHVLESAPHVLGVAGGDEPGRIARMLRRLGDTVGARKRAMSDTGATSFAALAAQSSEEMPRIVVLLDSYSGATSALERLDGGRVIERMERLVVEGPSVGVHFIITADRRAAVPSALTSVVTTRLVLRMAERDDYPLLGVDSAVSRQARMNAGRGFIQGSTEIQVAVRRSSDPVEERAALTAVLDDAARRYPVSSQRLGRMPGHVRRADLAPATSPLVLPFAIGDLEVSTVSLDLTEGHALVGGPARSGRSSTLATLAAAAAHSPQPPVLAVFLGRRSPLATAVAWSIGPVDATNPTEVAEAIEEIRRLVTSGQPVLGFVDDVDTLTDATSAALEELARQARDLPIRLIAATDTRWALRAYGGLVPELRKSKRGVLLTPEIELDGDLLGTRLRPPFESITGAGRGFLVQAGISELIQVAQIGAEDLSPPDTITDAPQPTEEQYS